MRVVQVYSLLTGFCSLMLTFYAAMIYTAQSILLNIRILIMVVTKIMILNRIMFGVAKQRQSTLMETPLIIIVMAGIVY